MAENITKTITTLDVTQKQLAQTKEEKFERLLKAQTDQLVGVPALLGEINKHLGPKDSIYMKNKDVYYYPCVVAVLPNLRNFAASHQQIYYSWQFSSSGWNNKFGGFNGQLASQSEVQKFFLEANYFRGGSWGRCLAIDGSGYGYGEYGIIVGTNLGYNSYDNCWYTLDNSSGNYRDREHALIPIFRMHGENSAPVSVLETVKLWLQHGLEPGESWFTGKSEFQEAYKRLRKLYRQSSKYWDYLLYDEDEGALSLDEKKVREEIAAGKNPSILTFDAVALFASSNIEVDEAYLAKLEKKYLECDKERAAIDKYDAKLLHDINRGHWDLWDYDEQLIDVELGGKAIIPGGLIARDPHSDIQEGTVAIDFGTKSTVVVYGEGALHNHPLQVGNGNYSEQEDRNKFENPTVVRFRDIESFRSAYEEREGRPATSWEHVCVSHTAFADMLKTSEANYNSFLCNLKQWCSNPALKIKLLDEKHHEEELKDFLTLTDDDFNPVEIYAYYIGSYVNNMLGIPKIYKHYLMSFPVTFDQEIRAKVLASFRAGLIKSLPTALVTDEDFMAGFVVAEGVTEPAAYAATALTEYDYDPEETGDVYYGVFDFGGGTTDFDFGVYREGAASSRCAYDLIHFGANGDRTLGGENILRYLAFEVFKFNRQKLRYRDEDTGKDVKIPFSWDMDRTEFIGYKDYIEESSQANQNMHNMMERLRPVWEAPESEEAQKILTSDEGFKVSLLDAEGNQRPNFTFYLCKGGASEEQEEGDSEKQETKQEKLDLLELITRRIESGVQKFFLTMREAFSVGIENNEYEIKPLDEIEEFTIFLAGNSSKAAIVRKLFAQYTKAEGDTPAQAAAILGAEALPHCIVREPLGLNSQDYAKPNGKTGVAFGLLTCRKGGEDVRVIDITPDEDAVPFQYYIGRNRKRKFKTYLSPNTKLKEWVEFIDAGSDFEIYYTDNPEALAAKPSLSIAKGVINVHLEESDSESVIYLRAVDSHRIEWCMAKADEEPSSEDVEGRIIDLRKA